jgi:hypothetical protein
VQRSMREIRRWNAPHLPRLAYSTAGLPYGSEDKGVDVSIDDKTTPLDQGDQNRANLDAETANVVEEPVGADTWDEGREASMRDTAAKRADAIERLGPMRTSARTLQENEGIAMTPSQGLQSRQEGFFQGVVEGAHGDVATKYLWTIDDRGINIGLESTPFPTARGNIVHTNISSRASIGGEAWFGSDRTVTINAGSGRFGDNAGVTQTQWNAAVEYWESLGYSVNAIPYGSR